MERKGLKDKDLIPAIGSKTTVSLVLNRKRPMKVEMVRKLSALLGLSVNLLIQPYTLVDKQEKINQ
jgi:HTH-type transcriptional regulator/antitoxin HigA